MRILSSVWSLCLVVFAGAVESPETVDTPYLYGIASVVVGKDAIEVTHDQTLPSGLDLRKDGARVSKATVKVGESFAVTDGHHIGHSFKLLAIEGRTARLETAFWMSFLGEPPTRSTSTMTVRSYVTRKKKP
jgi:hypothetical protein